jgi:hypothetical protein
MPVPGVEKMTSKNIFSILGYRGPALALLLFLSAPSQAKAEPRPRPMDVINTSLRTGLINLFMDAIPKPMLDPAIDDRAAFSYFARPSFTLGIRGEPFATQIIDGHLWTGAAEWALFLGNPPQIVNQRLWTLENDYLPCINYTLEREGVAYSLKAFQFHLDDSPGAPPVNFIKVAARNVSGHTAPAAFAGGFMFGIKDHRCQALRQTNFNPAWRYHMTEHAAYRGGKIIYAWRELPDSRQARSGEKCRGTFTIENRNTPSALTLYHKELTPGEILTATFTLPHYPAEPELESALAAADFEERLAAFTSFWETWLSRSARFEVAEPKVVAASKSYLIHALMSQDIISEVEVEQHVNRLHYNRFWLRDSSFFVSMYEQWGLADVGEALARHFFSYQREDGLFQSQKGQLDGWGQALWALGSHVRYTGDGDFARESLSAVEAAVDWLRRTLDQDAWGLMPPTDAFDNEMIQGRYTGHNFWALTGLDAAIDLCRMAGHHELAGEYQQLRDQYAERFLARLRVVAEKNRGVIPPGLDVRGGTDWGNLLPVYPGRILEPFDPLVTNTIEYIRSNRMEEGIMMWEKSLHHYLTERVAQTALRRGEQEHALDDFYAMLLHTGAGHEGFEWSIFPWNGRDYCINMAGTQQCNFPPHGWFAATFNLLFRSMLVREEDSQLHLCSAVSPEWADPGEAITVVNAPFWLQDPAGPRGGLVSYTVRFGESAGELKIDRLDWKGPDPEAAVVVFHLPYFLDLKNVEARGTPVRVEKDKLILPAVPLRLEFVFARRPVERKSYERSVEWYKQEYRRRWEERR